MEQRSLQTEHKMILNNVRRQTVRRLPTFLIIGASRSGTTSLHHILGQHPDIFMSANKETNFFAYQCSGGDVPLCTRVEDIGHVDERSVKTFGEYESLFRMAGYNMAIGETSPSYLLTPGVPAKILEFIPDIKIIAVLRQPIEKAYSHFLRKCQAGIYERGADFVAVLEQDEERIRREGRGVSFLGQGRYATYLEPYYDSFERNRIKICLFDDMVQQSNQFYHEIFDFLGVDYKINASYSAKFNQSGSKSAITKHLAHYSKPIRGYLRRNLPPGILSPLTLWYHTISSSKAAAHPPLSKELRVRLTEHYFGEEILRLERLTGLNLARWQE